MEMLVMGLNQSMDTKENIEKKKNTLMEYLMLHMKVRISRVCNFNRIRYFRNFIFVYTGRNVLLHPICSRPFGSHVVTLIIVRLPFNRISESLQQ